MYGFSSAKKMASVLVDQGDGSLRLYNKGASEWVLKESVRVTESDGTTVALTEAKREELMDIVTQMASRGLRTLVRMSFASASLLSLGLRRRRGHAVAWQYL